MHIVYLLIVFFALPLIVEVLLLRYYIKKAEYLGILAKDEHKKDKPMIPTMGGITFVIPVIIFYSLVPFILHDEISINEVIALISSFVIGYVIGLLDDKLDLSLKKVILSSIAAIPFLLLHAYNPKPVIPFIGPVRLSIIYPLILIAAFVVVPNGENMVDVHNGTLSTSLLAVLVPVAVWSYLSGNIRGFVYAIIGIGIVLGFFVYNKYPAKVFAGNVGSYSLGTLLISIIILSHVEFVAIIAWLPTVLAGFYILSSIGGLMTRDKIRKEKGKPVIVKDGVLYPSTNPNAPITLTRLILLEKGPLTEKEVIEEYYIIYGLSAFLAIITGTFMYF